MGVDGSVALRYFAVARHRPTMRVPQVLSEAWPAWAWTASEPSGVASRGEWRPFDPGSSPRARVDDRRRGAGHRRGLGCCGFRGLGDRRPYALVLGSCRCRLPCGGCIAAVVRGFYCLWSQAATSSTVRLTGTPWTPTVARNCVMTRWWTWRATSSTPSP